jgi:hypothetical protein
LTSNLVFVKSDIDTDIVNDNTGIDTDSMSNIDFDKNTLIRQTLGLALDRLEKMGKYCHGYTVIDIVKNNNIATDHDTD